MLVVVSRLCAALWLLLGCVWPVRAQEAQEPLARLALRNMEYEAPPYCPSRAQFLARLAARQREQPVATARERTLIVRIEVLGRVVRGHISLREGAQLRERELEASSCESAVDALSLVAALMMEGAAPAAPTTIVSKPAAKPRSQPKAAPLTRTAPAPAAATEQPPEDVSEAATRMEPASLSAATKLNVEVSAPATPARAPWNTHVSLGGSVLMLSGVAPAVRPGGAGFAQLDAAQSSPIALRAQLGLRAALAHTTRSADGWARFNWLAGNLRLCVVLPALRRLTLIACQSSELGRLRARGMRTLDARSARRPWLALGPTLLLTTQLGARIELMLGADLLLPVWRDELVLADQRLHRVPWLTVRGEFAVAFRLW